MKKKFYITTPIYYVNDKPHIGHAYTTIAADVISRYYKSCGTDVFFQTGTDEHGQKVEKAAELKGVEPQAHCDQMAPHFRQLWELLDIEPSAFIRTTDPEHKKFAADLLQKIYDNGHIEKGEYKGWYCTPCEAYSTEKEAENNEGNCSLCNRELEKRQEPAYFFKMSRFGEDIRNKIESNELKILPESRKNEVLGFLNEGLRDICISRPKKDLSWGVTLPFDDEFVCYVWMEALQNYMSGPTYLDKTDSKIDWWPADVHLIGKDILRFHGVYWPALLLALDMPLARAVVAHGWWNFSCEKMSKTTGNVVNPAELVEWYQGSCDDRAQGKRTAVDAFRYFLMAETTFGFDGNFSFEAFERRWTADLSNDIGNLVSRVVSLGLKLLNGKVESVPFEGAESDLREYQDAIEAYQFNKAIEVLLKNARKTNQNLQETQPWSNPDKAPDVLGRAVSILRFLSAGLKPFMPRSADEIAHKLGLLEAPDIPAANDAFIAQVSKGTPLFVRPQMDEKAAGVEGVPGEKSKKMKKEKEKEKKVSEEKSSYATIDDVKKLNLRIGKVVEAKKVDGADRLVELRVDIGEEIRTLVAGIAETYEPEVLIGRNVVVVANLKPAKIRGVKSQGMLLAAAPPDGADYLGPAISVLTPDVDVPPGSQVR